LPAELCTTEALQKWLETPDSGRYRTPATAVPPNGFPLGELDGCVGESTVEPGPAAAASVVAVLVVPAVGSGVTLPGAPDLSALDTVAACGAAAAAAAWVESDVEGLLDGAAEDGVSAAWSAATALAGDGLLNATPSIPAIASSPAAPAASAARRARARLRA